MTAPKPNPLIIDLLRDALVRAKTGEIQEIFLWTGEDDAVQYDYVTYDTQDMLYELGSAIMEVQIWK